MFIVPISNLPAVQSIDTNKTQEVVSGGSSMPFADVLQGAMQSLNEAREASAEDAYNLAMGDISSLHSMMINSAMETTAIETVVQLTSRAVSSYKEIMQMQI